MKDYSLSYIINNPDIIEDFITTLASTFPNFYYKYNYVHRDAISFYYLGHCPSFARILYAIFNGNVSFYVSESHVITKIGDNFYDIRGYVNDRINLSDYQEYSLEEFSFAEIALDKFEDHSIEIESDLIFLGKVKLNEIILNHNQYLIKKLVITPLFKQKN